jgi:hypothetical protein
MEQMVVQTQRVLRLFRRLFQVLLHILHMVEPLEMAMTVRQDQSHGQPHILHHRVLFIVMAHFSQALGER